MRKDPYAKERAELKQKAQGLNDPMSKFYSLLLENAKGEKGDTPIKGKDYFTPSERKEMIAEVLEKIPVPKDADPVDYDLILTYVTQEVEEQVKKEVAKLPKPKDGEPGKDAVVDIPAIVQALLKTMPKMESKEVDYLGIKDYIDKEVKKIKTARPQVIKSFTGGGATSIIQLSDVDLSGLSRNSDGQYILGSGGGGASAFTDLTDTPANYTGDGGKLLAVKGDESGVEFIAAPSGSGDVIGPGSSVDDNIALFNGVTGKIIKDGGVKASDFATAVHTHVASDVTDFQTAVSANSDVVANTAKISFDSTSSSKLAGIEAGAQVNTVTSVATKTGAVTLDTNDVTEATNLYYTEARVSANTDVAANSAARHDAATVLDSTSIDMIISGQQISAQREALTGDVTAAKNSNTTTIANNAVTNAKAAQMPANTIKGNNTGSTANAADLTAAQVRTLTETETTTQLNTRDTNNRARANHTGTQLASTISDFATAVAATAAVTANTAKVTNATHSGDMTGATALTAQPALITSKSSATVASGDLVLIADVSDSNNLKQVTAQSIADLGGGGGGPAPTVPLANWDFYYEWIAGSTTASAPDAFLGAAVSSGTNTTAIPAAAVQGFNPQGIFLRSSTTANGGYRYQTSSLVADYFGVRSRKFVSKFLWRTSFTGRTVRMGFLDTNTSADAADGAYFEIVDNECRAKTANNSTRTTNATTVTLSLDVAYTFDIEVNAAGNSARFRVYAGQTATPILDVTNTANIPTTSARAFGVGIVATESSTTASDIGIVYSMGYGTIEAYQKAKFWDNSYLLTEEASSATPTATGTALRNDYVATALTVNATLAAPSGTANANGMIRYRITASGGTRTIGYNAALLAGNITRTTSLAAGETLTQLYQRIGSTWVCVVEDVTS